MKMKYSQLIKQWNEILKNAAEKEKKKKKP
jgi:hypothetical protein